MQCFEFCIRVFLGLSSDFLDKKLVINKEFKSRTMCPDSGFWIYTNQPKTEKAMMTS